MSSSLLTLSQGFNLGLWSTLVFFKYGSEVQLAAALVINVMQLCVHVNVLPYCDKNGPGEAALLNVMQTLTLVLTTYINFGALTINYLEVSKTLALFVDPDSVGNYDHIITFIGFVMQLLTAFVLLTFGGFGGGILKNANPSYR